jgi:hypothetical protein
MEGHGSVADPLEVRYAQDSNVVAREIANEQILVPIRKQTADMAAIYVLNETGARIWQLLDGQRSLADISDLLVQEYDVQPDAFEHDLLEIIGQLHELGVVRVVSHAL